MLARVLIEKDHIETPSQLAQQDRASGQAQPCRPGAKLVPNDHITRKIDQK
jgi:hypothetical protein